ncbi:MAG: cytochrome c maturation protein CcmE [Chthonomonas sp.]|nr:cytochrome c maturation protein CcmE [Chthonomonas sp.]
MNLKLILPLVLGSIAITGMVFTFVSQASPYVNIAEAKKSTNDSMHLPGEMVKSTVQVSARERIVSFVLVDETGAKVPVVYKGSPPANMGEATKVVVIGKMQGDVFEADRMLLKCPSRYEAGKS